MALSDLIHAIELGDLTQGDRFIRIEYDLKPAMHPTVFSPTFAGRGLTGCQARVKVLGIPFRRSSPNDESIAPEAVSRWALPVFTPIVPARHALPFMHAKHFGALRAKPFSVLTFHESAHAAHFYFHQIVENGNAVLGTVASCQAVHPGTWKLSARDAKIEAAAGKFFAVFDRTRRTGSGLKPIITAAPPTGLFSSLVCAAETAIQSAGSN